MCCISPVPAWPAPDHLAARIVADPSPARAGACCATASSCSMTEANCFLMAVLSLLTAVVRPTLRPWLPECQQ